VAIGEVAVVEEEGGAVEEVVVDTTPTFGLRKTKRRHPKLPRPSRRLSQLLQPPPPMLPNL